MVVRSILLTFFNPFLYLSWHPPLYLLYINLSLAISLPFHVPFMFPLSFFLFFQSFCLPLSLFTFFRSFMLFLFQLFFSFSLFPRNFRLSFPVCRLVRILIYFFVVRVKLLFLFLRLISCSFKHVVLRFVFLNKKESICSLYSYCSFLPSFFNSVSAEVVNCILFPFFLWSIFATGFICIVPIFMLLRVVDVLLSFPLPFVAEVISVACLFSFSSYPHVSSQVCYGTGLVLC